MKEKLLLTTSFATAVIGIILLYFSAGLPFEAADKTTFSGTVSSVSFREKTTVLDVLPNSTVKVVYYGRAEVGRGSSVTAIGRWSEFNGKSMFMAEEVRDGK